MDLMESRTAAARSEQLSPGLGQEHETVEVPIQRNPFSVTFSAARNSAALPAWVTLHDLRHYYGSLLIRSGASVKVVQARLGDASAKTTLDVYGHLWSVTRTGPESGRPGLCHFR